MHVVVTNSKKAFDPEANLNLSVGRSLCNKTSLFVCTKGYNVLENAMAVSPSMKTLRHLHLRSRNPSRIAEKDFCRHADWNRCTCMSAEKSPHATNMHVRSLCPFRSLFQNTAVFVRSDCLGFFLFGTVLATSHYVRQIFYLNKARM